MSTLPHSIPAKVKQQNNDTILLETEGGQTLAWPSNKIANVELGETVQLVALSKYDVEKERALLAKHVLNYMLTGDEGTL